MPNPPTDPDILDVEGLARRLGIAPNTVRKLARNGEIPALRIGKVWRFYWPAVVGTVAGTPAGPGGSESDEGPGSTGS